MPRVADTVAMVVRLDRDTHDWLKAYAETDQRSMAAEVRRAIGILRDAVDVPGRSTQIASPPSRPTARKPEMGVEVQPRVERSHLKVDRGEVIPNFKQSK
jgi:plasmid stability protein